MSKSLIFEEELPAEKRVFYYDTFKDDPVRTEKQGKDKKVHRVELPEDYVYIQKNPFVRLYGWILYRGAQLFTWWYDKFYLHVTVKNRAAFKKAKGTGYVVYANHTHPLHDAFTPCRVCDRHIYTISIPANLFIPGVGGLLPHLGIIPLGSTPKQKQQFHDTIDYRLKHKNCLVIYPEAHVWPYATNIRPFPQGDKSFIYPVRNNLPIFTMTTTYQKPKDKTRVRPDMTVYIDGPFYPDPKKSDAENQAKLAKQAYESMVKWSKKSNYEYFQYRQTPHQKD